MVMSYDYQHAGDVIIVHNHYLEIILRYKRILGVDVTIAYQVLHFMELTVCSCRVKTHGSAFIAQTFCNASDVYIFNETEMKIWTGLQNWRHFFIFSDRKINLACWRDNVTLIWTSGHRVFKWRTMGGNGDSSVSKVKSCTLSIKTKNCGIFLYKQCEACVCFYNIQKRLFENTIYQQFRPCFYVSLKKILIHIILSLNTPAPRLSWELSLKGQRSLTFMPTGRLQSSKTSKH